MDGSSSGDPMGRRLKRVVVSLLSLVLVGACAGLLLFKLAERKIAGTMRPPHLERQPEVASDLTFRTLDGEVHHLSASKGQVVFLDLWGTWCIQCVAEMPTVQRLYDHYKNDSQVKFLIVSRMDSPAAVRSYARRNHLSMPFYVTEDQDIPPSMQLNQYPATFILAKDGSLVSKHVGAADWSDGSVVSFIDQLRTKE
jgi:thiol-disulfide isomerase/thioredoxin